MLAVRRLMPAALVMPSVLAAALVTACATPTAPTSTSPSASAAEAKPLEPLILGWEQFFKLDWEPGQRKWRPVVLGRVYNTWGETAANVQLLVDGLDTAGQLTEQKVAWLGTDVTPGTSAPFEVSVSQPAATYRVRVFAFEWVERGHGPRR